MQKTRRLKDLYLLLLLHHLRRRRLHHSTLQSITTIEVAGVVVGEDM